MNVCLQDLYQQQVPLSLIIVHLGKHTLFACLKSIYVESYSGQTSQKSQIYYTWDKVANTYTMPKTQLAWRIWPRFFSNQPQKLVYACHFEIGLTRLFFFFEVKKSKTHKNYLFKSSLYLLMLSLEWGSLYHPSYLFQARVNPSIVISLAELNTEILVIWTVRFLSCE